MRQGVEMSATNSKQLDCFKWFTFNVDWFIIWLTILCLTRMRGIVMQEQFTREQALQLLYAI